MKISYCVTMLMALTLCCLSSILMAEEEVVSKGRRLATISSLRDFRAQHLEDKLEPRLSFEFPVMELAIESKEGEASGTFSPSESMQVGLGLTYKGYRLGVRLPVAPSLEDRQQKGTTKYKDFILGHYWEQVGFDVFYQNYQGFYLDESDGVDVGEGYVYPQHPDLRLSNYGFNTYFSFDPEEYNLKFVDGMTSEAMERGGSYLGLVAVNHVTFQADRPFLSDLTLIHGDDKTSLTSARLSSVHVGGGYGYHQKYGSYYLGGRLLVGWGPQWQNLEFAKRAPLRRTMMSFKVSFSMDMGYRWENAAVGFQATYDSVESSVGNLDIGSQVITPRFFFSAQI